MLVRMTRVCDILQRSVERIDDNVSRHAWGLGILTIGIVFLCSGIVHVWTSLDMHAWSSPVYGGAAALPFDACVYW